MQVWATPVLTAYVQPYVQVNPYPASGAGLLSSIMQYHQLVLKWFRKEDGTHFQHALLTLIYHLHYSKVYNNGSISNVCFLNFWSTENTDIN